MSIFDNKCIEGDQSNQISEVSEMSFDKDILEDILEDNLEGDLENILVEEIDSKEIASFPNEVYGDLMTLVTKHKLSNASGNAIIKFLINTQILLHLLFQSLSNKGANIWIG